MVGRRGSVVTVPGMGRLIFALCLVLSIAIAEAQSGKVYDIRLPAQSVADGLNGLSEQTGVPVVFSYDLVKNRKGHSVSGRYTVQDALNTLLKGTGLAGGLSDKGVLTVSLTGPHAPPKREPLVTQTENTETHKDSAQKAAGIAGILASLAAAFGAHGQEAPTQPAVLQEVIVTAQKREERLQDVPVPVTAISGTTLLENNQLRLQDYFAAVPGLNFTTDANGQPFLSMRGITTGGGNPTVSVTVDDVPYGSSSTYGGGTQPAPDIDPSDLARVEVLRGPQGTLYGASNLGGLLKYVTVQPSTDQFSGRLEAGANRVSGGSDTGYAVRGAVNVPINDSVAARASAFTREDPGYIDNLVTGARDTNRVDVYGGHLSLLWRPSDAWSVKLSALFQDTKGHGAPTADRALGDLKQDNIADTGSFHLQSQSYSITLNGRMGAADLTSLTGFNIFSENMVTDVSPGIGAFVLPVFGVAGVQQPSSERTSKFSQEVRLSLPVTRSVDWLFGGFYTYEKSHVTDLWFAANPTTGAVAGNALDGYWNTSLSEVAAFTNLTVHFTPQFDVQFGGRESQNRQTYSEVDGGGYTTVFGFPGAPAPLVTPEVDTKDNSFTYLVTPRFKVSEDLMLYARLTSGYRLGGPNPTCSAFGIPCAFGPDKTTNYEIGAKGDTLDHKVSFDASVFYVDWKDIQLSVNAACNCAQYFANAGRAKSKGVELSVNARPWTGLTIGAWVDWNDAKLAEAFPSNAALIGMSGDRLPFSSRFTGNASVEQEFPLWSGTTGYAGGMLSYVGNRQGEFFFTPERPYYPSYTQTDLRVGLQNGGWRFGVFAKNIVDKRGITGGTLPNPWAGLGYTYIQPRTVGMSLSYSF